ncbi:Xylanase inhibitor, C-terminal [Sesbania bispinosa]|nr:Xylanase inhibitor, C-terminal [Sesbania bispinosa]
MTHYTFLLLTLCCIISQTHAQSNGFSVELIHRDSSKSPLYHSTQTHFQRVANAVRRSINRANHFNKASIPSSTAETIVTPDSGEYLMSYSIGTPPFQLFGIVDTGSDIVWLQCKPCETCYNQTSPMFDPSKSTTYRTTSCSSTLCKSVRDTSCSTDGKETCEYTINYGDNSHSQGDLSVDTLTLGSTRGSIVSFPKTVIGCGHMNTVSFQGQSSGIVGLGGGPVSLITQLGYAINGKFSYCLVPMFSESNTSSKLSFGDDAVVSGQGSVSTPIVPSTEKVFYFLTLEGFSVGGNRIDFGSDYSGLSAEGNIIIDSGTTLTLLPDDVYSQLESAVAKEVKLERVDDPSQQLSLCYKISATGDLVVPDIIAHFDGADVTLNALNTFVQVDDGIVCLAFAPSQSIAIFGNLAQQNLLVGYDLLKKTATFKPTDCTKH